MSFKKYMPSSTETVKIGLVVIVLSALGVLAIGQTWIRTNVLGRM